MKLSLTVPATEAVHTFNHTIDEIVFGRDDWEVSIQGNPDDLRRFADKITAAADYRDAVGQAQSIGNRAGLQAVTA